MRAYDILTALLVRLRAAMPKADVKESYGPGSASWLISRPTVAGQVEEESSCPGNNGGWEARLLLDIYLPRGGSPGALGEMARAISLAAEEDELLAGVSLGAPGTDKSTGALTASCRLSYKEPGSGAGSGSEAKKTYRVEIDGQEQSVTGWKVSVSESGKSLTAIGESVPFLNGVRREYTIELQGLDMPGAQELSGFSLRLAGQAPVYMDCRWKSFSAAGTAVAVSPEQWTGAGQP